MIKQKSVFFLSENNNKLDWIPIIGELNLTRVVTESFSIISIQLFISDVNYNETPINKLTKYFVISLESPAKRISIVFSVLIGILSVSTWIILPSTKAEAPRIIKDKLSEGVSDIGSIYLS